MRALAFGIALAAVRGLVIAADARAQPADPVIARSLAATCTNCHGTDGNPVPESAMPRLAGQSKAELVRKLAAYKEGKLSGTLMPQLAKGYTDAQIDAIAGWFAAQKAK